MESMDKLEKELLKEEKKLKEIEKSIEGIRDELEKVPADFSIRDFLVSFFGALIIGMTFVHKGALVNNVRHLTNNNVIAIIIITSMILIAEIYYIGYKRVKDKKKRPLLQFIIKRFITLYLVAIITSLMLIYLFAINFQLTSTEIFRLVVAMSMPCAIGAAVIDLLKKY